MTNFSQLVIPGPIFEVVDFYVEKCYERNLLLQKLNKIQCGKLNIGHCVNREFLIYQPSVEIPEIS